jgi:thioredoxin 1
MSNAVIYATDASFDADILKSDLAVLVDYWAPWCGPCKMIAPILDEIAADYAGRLKVVKINIDEEEQSAARFGVRNIPTLMLFKDGELQATKVGALSKSQLSAFIDSHL